MRDVIDVHTHTHTHTHPNTNTHTPEHPNTHTNTHTHTHTHTHGRHGEECNGVGSQLNTSIVFTGRREAGTQLGRAARRYILFTINRQVDRRVSIWGNTYIYL